MELSEWPPRFCLWQGGNVVYENRQVYVESSKCYSDVRVAPAGLQSCQPYARLWTVNFYSLNIFFVVVFAPLLTFRI